MKLKPCPSCVPGNRRECRRCAQTGFARKQPAYLKFVRTRPCAACGARPPSEAHHEYLDRNEKAFGQRTHDLRALPLCRSCHRRRTDAARGYFWAAKLSRHESLEEMLSAWMGVIRQDFERGKGTA